MAAKTNKKFAERTPSSPLQEPLARYVVLLAERDARLRATALNFLHALRADATQRLQALKRIRRVQTYDDLIDGVALALEGPQRLTLVRQLRAQYRIALVDEFRIPTIASGASSTPCSVIRRRCASWTWHRRCS